MFSIFIILAMLTSGFLAEPTPGYDPTDPSQVAESESSENEQDDPGLGGPTVDQDTLDPRQGRRGEMMADGMANLSVEGLLEARCGQCHGPRKQKAGVQVVPVENIFTGPEKDWVVLPGQPEKSSLLERIILPAGHDDVMPPDGPTLSEQQIRQIRTWIQNGADATSAREGSAVSMNQGRRGQGNRQIRPRAWFEAYMGLDLSPEQRRSAMAVTRRIQRETREFHSEWGDRLQQLQKRVEQSGREQNEDAVQLRKELQTIKSKLPDVASAQETLWKALDSDQQAAMRAKLDELKLNRRASRSDRGNTGAKETSEPDRSMDDESRRRLRLLLDERRKVREDRPGNDPDGD